MENETWTGGSLAVKLAEGFFPLFYILPPSWSSFATVAEVPDYVSKALPYILVLIAVESIVRFAQGLPKIRVNDGITSVSAGMLMTVCSKVLVKGLEVGAYMWVHEHFHLVNLPWDSSLTWFLTFLCLDFFYYWFHRMAHEVNIFWAAHQMHHSSEEYNLTTALRQGAVQRFVSWAFYLPMALAIPPAQFAVHKQFNLLYQFWIHTEVVGRLGPLEYILNTPSHHRVHHGRNRYCIDKNYGGVLIIWDRMFGSFQPELEGKIYYGLVHPLGTFNPLLAQLCHYFHIAKAVWTVPGHRNKISVFFQGPGWSPGKPRFGDPDDIPEIPVVKIPYDKQSPPWIDIYCIVHFFLAIAMSLFLSSYFKVLPYWVTLGIGAYFTLALTCFGMIFDHSTFAPVIEVSRLLILLLAEMAPGTLLPLNEIPGPVLLVGRAFVHLSAIVWVTILVKQLMRCGKIHSE